MAEDFWESIRCNFEEITKLLEELKWQQYLPLLPNKLFVGEDDTRSEVLLALSWLLTDLTDSFGRELAPKRWYSF